MMACSPCGGITVGLEGSVAAVFAAVTALLARDRRRRAADPGSDPADAEPGASQIGDLKTFVLGQVAGADLARGQRVERGNATNDMPLAVDLVATRPVAPTTAC